MPPLRGFTRPNNRKLRYTSLEQWTYKPRPLKEQVPRAMTRSSALFRLMDLPEVPLFRILSFPETVLLSLCNKQMHQIVKSRNIEAKLAMELLPNSHSISVFYKLQSWWVGRPIEIDSWFLRTSGLYPPNTPLRTVADYEAASKVLIDYFVDLFHAPITDCTVHPAGLTDLCRFLAPHMNTMVNVWTDEQAEFSRKELEFLLGTTPDTLIVRGVFPENFSYRGRALPAELWIQHSSWVSDTTFYMGSCRVLFLEDISRGTMRFATNTINQWLVGGHPHLKLLVVKYSNLLTEEQIKMVFSYGYGANVWAEDTTSPRYLDIMLGPNKKCIVLKRLVDGLEAMVHLDEEQFAFRVLRE